MITLRDEGRDSSCEWGGARNRLNQTFDARHLLPNDLGIQLFFVVEVNKDRASCHARPLSDGLVARL
jgi:hypothetical protein